MKITMDGKYTTRDGRAVRILCVDGPVSRYGHWPVVGWIVGDGDIRRWDATGKYDADHLECDLVPVKPEPVVEWGLVRVSDNKWADSYGSERIARAIATDPANVLGFRLAKRTTEIVE